MIIPNLIFLASLAAIPMQPQAAQRFLNPLREP